MQYGNEALEEICQCGNAAILAICNMKKVVSAGGEWQDCSAATSSYVIYPSYYQATPTASISNITNAWTLFMFLHVHI